MHASAPIPSDVEPWTLRAPSGKPIGQWRFAPGDTFQAFAVTRAVGRSVVSFVFFAAPAPLTLVDGSIALVGAGFFLSRKHRGVTGPNGARVLFTTPRCLVLVAPGPLDTRTLVARWVGPSPVDPSPESRAVVDAVPRRGREGMTFSALLGPFAVLADAPQLGKGRVA